MSGDIEGYLAGCRARASAGNQWIIDCPWCTRNNLYVNCQEDKTNWNGTTVPVGAWICFSCGQKSMSFAALMSELDGITFHQARDLIGRWKMGNHIWVRPKVEVAPAKMDGTWLPPEYEPVTAVWPKYLTARGITKPVAYELNLGVCRKGDFAHRIIIPIECPLGRDFQARAILDGMEPRYLSGPTSGQLLFGWSTVEESDTAVLVEGPFDAIAVLQAGFPCVAMMGKELRDGQFQMLSGRRRSYTILLDPISKDREAVRSACVAADRLGGLVANNLDAPCDPGDTIKPGGPGVEMIQKWVAEAIPPRVALAMAMEIWLRLDREARQR